MARDSGEVWYTIPSASVERCRRTLPVWREMGYKVAVLQNVERGEIPADVVVWADEYPGWAASVNRLCRGIVPGDAPVVVTGGDDMLPDPDEPAGVILEAFQDRFPDGFGVMQPIGDGFLNVGEYCGSPWLGRGWIERAYGGAGPMHPGYRHNWADHELRWVSEALGALWMDPSRTQRHEHFTRTGEAPPEYWEREVGSRDRDDVELFLSRVLQGFPGHGPVDGEAVEKEWWRERYTGVAHRHWQARHAAEMFASDSSRRLSAMLGACAERGLSRVAVFGAGTETRRAGDALCDPPVEVCCVIDDDVRVIGRRIWGLPVVSAEDPLVSGVEAIACCVRSVSPELDSRLALFEARGIEVLRPASAGPDPRPARAKSER